MQDKYENKSGAEMIEMSGMSKIDLTEKVCDLNK
jgi:hypothetical protein